MRQFKSASPPHYALALFSFRRLLNLSLPANLLYKGGQP